MASADLKLELECPVCLGDFMDPVMLSCGHNFCSKCIDEVFDTQMASKSYSCPQCRETFKTRPALQRNLFLRKVVLNYQSANSDQKTEGVTTRTMDSAVPAERSCLHFEPTTSSDSQKCFVHKEPLQYHCSVDNACICLSCTKAAEHRGHQVEMLAVAFEKKKKKLQNGLQELNRKGTMVKDRLQGLQECSKVVQEEATGKTQKVNELLEKIKQEVENLEERVPREVSRQKDQVLHPITEKIHAQEAKKEELARRRHHLEELYNMTDPIALLQEPDIGDFGISEEGGDDTEEQVHGTGNLNIVPITKYLNEISDLLAGINRGIYVQDCADIVLDQHTAGSSLCLSNDRKTAYKSSPNRLQSKWQFDCPQVLSTRTFSSGRHNWEVTIDKSDDWRIGMCYPSIDRRGKNSGLGYDKKSWCLRRRFDKHYTVRHDNVMVNLPYNVCSDKVRVCLNYEAGKISFYELSDPVRHLYTYTAAFTEPLHAALCVWGGSMEICG